MNWLMYQKPCLRIPTQEGNDTWLYESDEVIKYLQKIAA